MGRVVLYENNGIKVSGFNRAYVRVVFKRSSQAGTRGARRRAWRGAKWRARIALSLDSPGESSHAVEGYYGEEWL